MLQDERNTRAEEAASLKGNITALEAQLEALKMAISGAEQARQQSSVDCTRLRDDLLKTIAQRDEAQANAATLQTELSRCILYLSEYSCCMRCLDTICTKTFSILITIATAWEFLPAMKVETEHFRPSLWKLRQLWVCILCLILKDKSKNKVVSLIQGLDCVPEIDLSRRPILQT